MSRLAASLFATVLLAGLPALAAPPSGGCPTATGDAWLNENDYDYNRAHMLPRHDGCPAATAERTGAAMGAVGGVPDSPRR